ncbi:NAD-dependent epimerase/dehydratase family protein [Pseudomonadota bacterium]|nr:NAD-dependent epimerase/dehydratase family protein [Pseudomonadota bacterium]
MNIALTGASGSIGKDLKPFLESLGHSIITISHSIPANGQSIFSYTDLVTKNIPIDINAFIHLASLNSNLLKDDIDQEVELTRLILDAMQSLNCSRLIFFSTAKVYGDNSFSENSFLESSALNPVCPYSKAKKICEDLIQFKSAELDFDSTILRLPPVLSQDDTSNLGKLIRLSKSGTLIPTFSCGDTNLRSFISIVNIKKVIRALLESSSASCKKVYNLADDKYISLNNLLRIYGGKRIIVLPTLVEKLIFKISFVQGILLKLYGNFMIENRQLKNDLGVKIYSTQQAVLLYKKPKI